jgi:hypothetical protein
MINGVIKRDILFVGNSHTYLHYMPQMLEQLVKAGRIELGIAVDQIVGEGASLEWHWNNEPTREKIRSLNWDYIVLQDRSGGPLEDPKSFRRHAELLNGEIQACGARTIFYMTWPNRSRPETVSILAGEYRQAAVRHDALLAPVGLAWARAQELNFDLALHHRDGRHANPVGAYLTACVFYSVLLNSSPEGLAPSFFIEGKMRPEQNADQALQLQKVAWEFGSRKWEFGSRKGSGDPTSSNGLRRCKLED